MKLYREILLGFLAAGNLCYAQKMPQQPVEYTGKSEVKSAVTIASLVKGLKKYEGFFTFYYDEKSGKVLLEVDKLDKEFLYFTSLSNGIGNGGPERGQASSAIAKFIKTG